MRATTPAPTLGQHTHDVMCELGMSADDITDLTARGVIG
jgi:crotonobetainyl-CoA:carnitine CoA-transferase CaiB-like acyl-CoA transferase